MCQKNKLESLPESIGICISLEELQANDNSIKDLPSSICNLGNLKSLCLNNNNVHQTAVCCITFLFIIIPFQWISSNRWKDSMSLKPGGKRSLISRLTQM